MNQTYQFTKVTAEDIPSVTQTINSAYHGEPGQSWTSESHLVAGQRTTEASVQQLIQQPAVTMLKCTDEQEQVIGCVLLEEKKDTLYLGMLSVSPKTQAAGIGKLLLQQSEVFAREHGYQHITITVIDQRHELIGWYKRRGFVPTGKLEPFANASSAALAPFSFMEMRKAL